MKHLEDDDLHEAGLPVPVAGTPIDPVVFENSTRANQTQSVFGHRWKTLKELGAPDWSSWFSTAPPRRRWLLERPGLDGDTAEHSIGIFPLGKVGMLAAAGGLGKTMALVQLALAVATGAKWLDTFDTPHPGHVLLALGEEDAEEMRRRFYYAAKIMRLTDAQIALAVDRIVPLPLAGTRIELTETSAGGQVTETAALSELRELLSSRGHEWRLIILDPLSRFAGCDTEKDNAAATRFIEAAETLVRAPGGPSVLLAHHTTKAARSGDSSTADASAARGASALTDGVRWVANLDPVKDEEQRVWLSVTKSNYSRRTKVMLIRDEGGALRRETQVERERRETNEPKIRKSKTNGSPSVDAYRPPADVD